MVTACGPSQEAQDASAQDASAQDVPIAADQETNWTVIPEGSFIKFSALQQGKEFEGESTNFEASILFYADNLEASNVTVTIPIKGVEAGDKDRNDSLPAKAWFYAKSFPVATFMSDNITKTAEGTYLAKGPLSIKGMTQGVSLPFTLSPANSEPGGTTVMTGSMSLDRTDWKVGEDPWDTDEWVSKDVSLDVQIKAIRK